MWRRESAVYPSATESLRARLERASDLKFNPGLLLRLAQANQPGDWSTPSPPSRKSPAAAPCRWPVRGHPLYGSIITASTHKTGQPQGGQAAKVIKNTQPRPRHRPRQRSCSVIFERLGIDALDVLEAAGAGETSCPFAGMVGGRCIGIDPALPDPQE